MHLGTETGIYSLEPNLALSEKRVQKKQGFILQQHKVVLCPGLIGVIVALSYMDFRPCTCQKI